MRRKCKLRRLKFNASHWVTHSYRCATTASDVGPFTARCTLLADIMAQSPTVLDEWRQTAYWATLVTFALGRTWRTCSSTWRMPRIELNGEGEPVWLTPHPRDPQPEGERERYLKLLCFCGTIKTELFDFSRSYMRRNLYEKSVFV